MAKVVLICIILIIIHDEKTKEISDNVNLVRVEETCNFVLTLVKVVLSCNVVLAMV